MFTQQLIFMFASLVSAWRFPREYYDEVKQKQCQSFSKLHVAQQDNADTEEEVDVAIIGAGIGGLCAGAILNTLYGYKVGVYEAHYLPGGCAHAFDRAVTDEESGEQLAFTFDSGPTIVLGCSKPPFNPLRQVLNAVKLEDEIEWIRYDGWGMIENPPPSKSSSQGFIKSEQLTDKRDDMDLSTVGRNTLRWKLQVGENSFEQGPMKQFGGPRAQEEWKQLRELTKPLVSGAVDIPAMAMRSGKFAVLPLLRYFKSLAGLIAQGDLATGSFDPFMNGPIYKVTDEWLRNWLDALAFSLSGLPAERTPAAAMAYVLFDMHRDGTALDYPKGGMGKISESLVKGVEQGTNNSKVNLRKRVRSIDTTDDGSRVLGITLQNGLSITARKGVIGNVPIWCIQSLLDENGKQFINKKVELSKDILSESFLERCNGAKMTRSFLHLHLAIKSKGLDLNSLEAHYTVMDRGLSDPCGELNMIAVSNPCVLDRTLAPDGYIVIHAYGAGNESYEVWKGMDTRSESYQKLKEDRAEVLWRAVESIIPDVKDRTVLSLIGSPLTHERFLNRPRGTYGAVVDDLLKDGSTGIENFFLTGDGIFPGIGIPAVAVNGASAANSLVSVLNQWVQLDKLKNEKLI